MTDHPSYLWLCLVFVSASFSF